MTKHEIDEGAFERAFGERGHEERAMARQHIGRYLAALPAEPEIEGGVRVRVCVAAREDGGWFALGNSRWRGPEIIAEVAEMMSPAEYAIRWIEATVPPYAAPAEPVVEGRVCE